MESAHTSFLEEQEERMRMEWVKMEKEMSAVHVCSAVATFNARKPDTVGGKLYHAHKMYQDASNKLTHATAQAEVASAQAASAQAASAQAAVASAQAAVASAQAAVASAQAAVASAQAAVASAQAAVDADKQIQEENTKVGLEQLAQLPYVQQFMEEGELPWFSCQMSIHQVFLLPTFANKDTMVHVIFDIHTKVCLLNRKGDRAVSCRSTLGVPVIVCLGPM
jgi:hypothetical protein